MATGGWFGREERADWRERACAAGAGKGPPAGNPGIPFSGSARGGHQLCFLTLLWSFTTTLPYSMAYCTKHATILWSYLDLQSDTVTETVSSAHLFLPFSLVSVNVY